MKSVRHSWLPLLLVVGSDAFSTSRIPMGVRQHTAVGPLQASIPESPDAMSRSFVVPKEEVNAIIRFGEGEKEKIVNAFGLWCATVSVFTGPIWMAAMSAVDMFSKMNADWDPNRSVFDKTGKIWSKVWLSMVNSYPEITGEVDQLKEGQGPCLYVANHASWLDIPVLCTVLDPVFKFIAKGELSKVPCIGQQLQGGNHILIDRDDRRSQLRTFKEGIGWLKKGVPIMAFPEGMRSPDGRLMELKGGLFLMAMKTKVPIVPISIAHTHAIMPGFSLFPIQSGSGKLHVHVHKPIDTDGKTETELEQLVRSSFLSMLPEDQHPLDSTPDVLTHHGLNAEYAQIKSIEMPTAHHTHTGSNLSQSAPSKAYDSSTKVRS